MKQITIDSKRSKRYCQSLIAELPEDGTNTVTIKKTDMSPTARQRKLQWLWNTEVALSGIGGDSTKENVHIRAKWMFARPILLRDDEIFSIIYDAFVKVTAEYDNATRADMTRKFSDEYIHKETMTRKQRAEYLTSFREYWDEKGVELTDPRMQGVDLGIYDAHPGEN